MKKTSKTVRAFAFGPAQYFSDINGRVNLGFQITDIELLTKIISGEYRGISPEYRIRKWNCSICHGDLEECSHEIGKQYGDLTCQMIAKDAKVTGVSLVDVPKDPRCRLIDLLVVKHRKRGTEYIWYGFKVNTDRDRFKNIQEARERGLIPEKVAFFFAEFFSSNLEGKAVFHD